MGGNRLLWYYKLVYVVGVISICLLFVIVYRRSGTLPNMKIEPKKTRTIDNRVRCHRNVTKGSQFSDFQAVNVSQTTIYSYSALLGDASLKIITLKERDAIIKGLYCVLWYPPDQFKNHWRSSTVEASVKNLNEHHNLYYTAAFVTCPLQERLVMSNDGTSEIIQKGGVIPGTVSLVTTPHDIVHSAPGQQPLAEFPVIPATVCSYDGENPKHTLNQHIFSGDQTLTTETLGEEDNRVEFTVCVSVLAQGFSNAAQLVEKIEMSRLLGAGRVVFYKHSISTNVDAVLRMYSRERQEGRESLDVVVHSWRLPSVISTETVHNLGQVASINDCLYRYRLSSKFIVFSDLGQHIILRQHHTWHQFISHVQRITPDISGFAFSTAIFWKDWPSPALGFKSTNISSKSEILQFSKREACVSPESAQTKMIVEPLAVEEMGVHSAWRLTGTIYSVSSGEGLVHEYSTADTDKTLTEEEEEKCSSSTIDTYMADKYGTELSLGLKLAWSKISENPGQSKESERQAESSNRRANQVLPNLALPVKEHEFRLVSGLGTPLFVYSALWRGDNVRLVVIKQQKYALNEVYCVFMQESTRFVEKAVVKNFPQFVRPFTSASVTCPIQIGSSVDNLPLFVGLVLEKNRISTPKELFIVEGRDDEQTVATSDGKYLNKKVEFTVCIPAMFNFGNVAQLVEKIEMSRLLGAGRVVFYKNSVTANVNTVLDIYTREKEEGRESLDVVVHSWRLPRISGEQIQIQYFAQLASIDDCLHRYRWTSNYTEFSDMDEFIVPVQYANRSQLLAARERLKPQSVAFMFLCTVFRNDDWQPAQGWDKEAMQFGSSVLGYTHREDYVYPRRVRSKLIVKPKLVEEMGVHFMWTPRNRTDVVPPTSGLLHHYRKPIDTCDRQKTDSRVAQHYGKDLAFRLKAVWAKLPGVNLGWKSPQKRDPHECQ